MDGSRPAGLVPAVVAAGDRRAAKAIHGESKPYLALAGMPLVAHVVALLQDVPEVSAVFVVGDPDRLARALAKVPLRKPLEIVPQFRNLYENAWETYRRLLPGAGPQGRDPGPDDERVTVLYLSADLPFATAQEISAFVRQGLALDCDYALGLCTAESMAGFLPEAPGAPGIRMAYFNLREGRFRQSNLHLVRPARLGNRQSIEEMYEHRYQKQIGQMIALAWRLLRVDGGGLDVLWMYVLMQLASIADRSGLRSLADWLRRRIPMARIARGVGRLLRTDFRFVVTEAGGCAIDLDNEHDFDAARARFDAWRAAQERRAAELYGPAALPPGTGEAVGDRA
jgi:GTP:adenosylcobinamide-phosphate guanylyltransferase